MADKETLKLAEEELARLIMVYHKQGLSDPEILRLLLNACLSIADPLEPPS